MRRALLIFSIAAAFLVASAASALAQVGNYCDMTGEITYNGNHVGAGKSVTCIHGGGEKTVTTYASASGQPNYTCSQLNEGTVTLKYNGQTAGPCPRSCQYPDETCNANVTCGGGEASATFSFLMLPPSLAIPFLRRRSRRDGGS